MTSSEIIRLFRGNPRKSRQVVHCPAHDDRGASLSLTAMKDKMRVKCFAGCSQDEILAAVGIRWQDLYYEQRQKMDPKAYREAQEKRKAQETHDRNLRVGRHVLRHLERGYATQDRDADMSVACAAAMMLTVKETDHWHRILGQAFERMEAANHLRERGMLGRQLKEAL